MPRHRGHVQSLVPRLHVFFLLSSRDLTVPAPHGGEVIIPFHEFGFPSSTRREPGCGSGLAETPRGIRFSSYLPDFQLNFGCFCSITAKPSRDLVDVASQQTSSVALPKFIITASSNSIG